MKPTSSPWGKIDHSERFSSAENVYIVGSPSHGGLMMPESEAARLKIKEFGEPHQARAAFWTCFEEDCQISVAILALTLNGFYPFNEKAVSSALLSVSYWNKEYISSLNFNEFGEVGNQVKELMDSLKDELGKIESTRMLREKSEKMRSEKSPDFIVSAASLNNYQDVVRFLSRLPRDFKDHDDLGKNREILRALQNEVEFYEKDEDGLFSKPGVVLVYTADGSKHLVRNYDSSRDLNLLSLCEKLGTFLTKE
jgi:hypothetical protein